MTDPDDIRWPVRLHDRFCTWIGRNFYLVFLLFSTHQVITRGWGDLDYLLVGLLLTASFWWFYFRSCWPLKKVVAYENHLEVGNFRHFITIPYQQISQIETKQERSLNVILTLHSPCEYGDTIHFLAREKFPLADHFPKTDVNPVVQLIESQRQANSAQGNEHQGCDS